MYLYTSVFSAGMRNIVTQIFFDTYYPEDKETLVSIALFFSALCTTVGIISSSRVNEGNIPKRSKIVITMGMTILVSISFASMFLVRTFMVYTLLFGIASFGINYMYNVYDVFISGSVSPEERENNVRILLSYQMAGYVVGPFFFSVFAENQFMCIVFVLFAQLAGYATVAYEYIKAPSKNIVKNSSPEKKKKFKNNFSLDSSVKKNDQKAMTFCFLMYFSTEVLLPSIAYLLKDYLKVSGYAIKSSIFLAIVVISSAVVIVFFSAPRSWEMRYVPPMSMGIALSVLMILRSNHMLTLAVIALASGLGYGMFLSGSRYYANSAEAERGLVHRYNMIKTEATLLGYLASAFISWICGMKNFSVVPAKMCLIISLLALALFQSSFFKLKEKNETADATE
jgi:MFS family permease